jgi:glycosyltransferase involved in cell wall biosynthesis
MISIILPVHNEARMIRQVLQSLLAQQNVDLEVLVIDGQSTDDSPDIVREISAHDPRIRLLTNERRKTPFAFNIGLRESKGEYVCILGAHCEYAPDYIEVCLREMRHHQAVGCSGKVITRAADDSWQASLTAWVMAHPFGVSGASFRTQPEGFVDSIPYPIFRKQVLLELGGYNEQLSRNQDNDMNYRIRAAGHRLYCTWQTTAIYYARRNLRELWLYADSNGRWCGVNARLEPRSLGLRHYIPLLFILGLLGALVLTLIPSLTWLGLGGLAAIPLHFLLGLVFGGQIAIKEKRWLPLLLPPVFFLFHLAYGRGFLQELLAPRLLRNTATGQSVS